MQQFGGHILTLIINKIERIQTKAVKWILSEQHKTYTDIEYFNKCNKLDLLPLKYRLDFFALLLFHKIIHKKVKIKLPTYIRLVSPSNLRTSHTDPLTFRSSIKPRIMKRVNNAHKTRKKKYSQNTKITSKCKTKITLKIDNKKNKNKKQGTIKKRKGHTFFRKRKKSENIYKINTKINEDFAENKEFSNSYFYRTHNEWNNLPLELKIIEQYELFSEQLKKYIWECVLERNSLEVSDNLDVTLTDE